MGWATATPTATYIFGAMVGGPFFRRLVASIRTQGLGSTYFV